MRFGKESDALTRRSFLFALQKHHSPWKTNALNRGVRGSALIEPQGSAT